MLFTLKTKMTAGLVFPHAALPSPLFFLSLFSTCPIVFFSSLLVVPSPHDPRIYLLSPFTNPSLLSVPSSLCAPSSNTPLCKDSLETSLIDAVGSWCYCFLVSSRSGSPFENFFCFLVADDPAWFGSCATYRVSVVFRFVLYAIIRS